MTTATPPSPDATATAAASPVPLPPGQAWSLGQPAPESPSVEAAQGLKEAVASKSSTMGAMADTLDSWAINMGDTHISAWDVLISLGVVAVVMVGAWMISGFAGRLLGRATRLDGTQRVLAQKIISILIWAAAFFVSIDLLGIDLTAFAVFSGAFGLAIGFGLQKTFGNLIAGIILLMDKSIKPGDVISVTDQAGNESFGQIRKIGIRAISVITRDRTEYLIPNENLMINQVVNWSYSSRDVRVKVPVGVSYCSDMDLVQKLLLQAAKDTPRILHNPQPQVMMVGFGESSVDFEIRFWIDDPEDGLGNVRSEVFNRVWKLFKENNVEIPFPQRDINLRGNDQFERLIAALADREEKRSKT
ncbi:mechanosensitive ion channel domain-containing protein [Altererythrobacter sp.]|uniref:mechanosensitive ion channel family protein n=1 Tax=Altererythrobacter sp. TaxID=1872480 RepID=UPI003D04C10D